MGSSVLPAYAGMIPAPGRIENPGAGAPRVCGDDPMIIACVAASLSCSPRMRG